MQQGYLAALKNTAPGNGNVGTISWISEDFPYIKRSSKKTQRSNNSSNNSEVYNHNLFISKRKLPKTGIEIKIGAIIYIMLVFPRISQVFDEKISLIDRWVE